MSQCIEINCNDNFEHFIRKACSRSFLSNKRSTLLWQMLSDFPSFIHQFFLSFFDFSLRKIVVKLAANWRICKIDLGLRLCYHFPTSPASHYVLFDLRHFFIVPMHTGQKISKMFHEIRFVEEYGELVIHVIF